MDVVKGLCGLQIICQLDRCHIPVDDGCVWLDVAWRQTTQTCEGKFDSFEIVRHLHSFPIQFQMDKFPVQSTQPNPNIKCRWMDEGKFDCCEMKKRERHFCHLTFALFDQWKVIVSIYMYGLQKKAHFWAAEKKF